MQSWNLNRPIVCNEDSPCIGQLAVAYQTGTSWGYYNNPTKQDPPADWSITQGEDTFFARRMAEGMGIPLPELPEGTLLLPGLRAAYDSGRRTRWLHVAALYPEKVDTSSIIATANWWTSPTRSRSTSTTARRGSRGGRCSRATSGWLASCRRTAR